MVRKAIGIGSPPALNTVRDEFTEAHRALTLMLVTPYGNNKPNYPLRRRRTCSGAFCREGGQALKSLGPQPGISFKLWPPERAPSTTALPACNDRRASDPEMLETDVTSLHPKCRARASLHLFRSLLAWKVHHDMLRGGLPLNLLPQLQQQLGGERVRDEPAEPLSARSFSAHSMPRCVREHVKEHVREYENAKELPLRMHAATRLTWPATTML